MPALARVPFLSVFGDYLDGTMWQPFADECRELAEKLAAAGGTAQASAPGRSVGITGNSHMLMMENNSLELAELLVRWIDDAVPGSRARASSNGCSSYRVELLAFSSGFPHRVARHSAPRTVLQDRLRAIPPESDDVPQFASVQDRNDTGACARLRTSIDSMSTPDEVRR